MGDSRYLQHTRCLNLPICRAPGNATVRIYEQSSQLAGGYLLASLLRLLTQALHTSAMEKRERQASEPGPNFSASRVAVASLAGRLQAPMPYPTSIHVDWSWDPPVGGSWPMLMCCVGAVPCPCTKPGQGALASGLPQKLALE